MVQNHKGVPHPSNHWRSSAPLVTQNQQIYSWQRGSCLTQLTLVQLRILVCMSGSILNYLEISKCSIFQSPLDIYRLKRQEDDSRYTATEPWWFCYRITDWREPKKTYQEESELSKGPPGFGRVAVHISLHYTPLPFPGHWRRALMAPCAVYDSSHCSPS